MSILGKIVETVAHVMPDRDPDEIFSGIATSANRSAAWMGAPKSLARHTSPLIIR